MNELQLLEAIATAYGLGAAGAALLQARQIKRRGSSCDVSARFFATYAGGYGIWLIYGLSIESLPLVVVDGVGLVAGLATLAVTLRMRGSLMRPRTWGSCPRPAPAAGAALALPPAEAYPRPVRSDPASGSEGQVSDR